MDHLDVYVTSIHTSTRVVIHRGKKYLFRDYLKLSIRSRKMFLIILKFHFSIRLNQFLKDIPILLFVIHQIEIQMLIFRSIIRNLSCQTSFQGFVIFISISISII